ncbi:hypothetical protein SUGI_0690430 [Cryptomeria japonica]|nr:hypothetical protein SUGI_0690430 [Cryptomeria japonica]
MRRVGGVVRARVFGEIGAGDEEQDDEVDNDDAYGFPSPCQCLVAGLGSVFFSSCDWVTWMGAICGLVYESTHEGAMGVASVSVDDAGDSSEGEDDGEMDELGEVALSSFEVEMDVVGDDLSLIEVELGIVVEAGMWKVFVMRGA